MLLRNVAPLWPFNGFTSFEDVGKRQGKTWEYFVPEVLGFAYLLYTAPCMHLDHAQGWTQPTPHEIQPQGTDGFFALCRQRDFWARRPQPRAQEHHLSANDPDQAHLR